MKIIALLLCTLLAAENSPRQGRGVWCNPGIAPYEGDWDRSAKLLADNGFNMIFPLMLSGGAAHYASDVLPRSAVFKKHGDQLEQCCAAAKKHGVEVHVWKVNFNLLSTSKEFIETMRRDGRTQVNVRGKPFDWLCPSHPENRKLELEAMLEVVRKYPIDGLHLDYIRYPGRKLCYCDGCRRRFEADSGRPVTDWPTDCFSGSRKEEYNQWRRRQIASLVEEVSREARKIRPDIKISAAVFGAYPDCRESRAQDWPEWIEAGYLDFVCPMNYTENDKEFSRLVKDQVKIVGGRIPLFPGIGASATESLLTADQVREQIRLARSFGADGFVIFKLSDATAQSIIPALGQKLEPPGAAAPTVPNAEFDQGGDSPVGWTLSGGQGRWIDRESLEVSGTGEDGNHWSCKCRLTPGSLYRFETRARSKGGGRRCITGPASVNRDYALTEDWRWHGHVFRAPDDAGEEILRVGQWHAMRPMQFDAVRLEPVMPIHKRVGDLRLGEGESIRDGQYHFRGEFSGEGSNYHRPLESATARFNSNRWCFAGDNQVTYRFSLPGCSFRSGKAGFIVIYLQRGGYTAEVGRDGKIWRTLISKNDLGLAEADLPADLFPAEAIYLRLRPSTAESSFQVFGVGFSGELSNPLPDGEGRTLFAEFDKSNSNLVVEELLYDDSQGPKRPKISLTIKNHGSAAAPVSLWRLEMPAAREEGTGIVAAAPMAPIPTPGTQATKMAPGERITLTAEIPLSRPGRRLIRLGVRSDESDVFTTSITFTLPEYYAADYGRRIEGVGGPANVWWCESGWKIAPNRPAPEDVSAAAELSAARNDREAVQVVVRPTEDLRQLTAEAGALVGPDGATIPAKNIQVLRVFYHAVHTPTDSTGSRDDWPDALPPLDKPLDVPAGRNQPLWVLVHVPKDARPGNYSGKLTLKGEGFAAEVPLRLHVWDFALPERNHLETAFGLWPEFIMPYHRLKSDADKRRVWDMYLRNFAEHRVSPYDAAALDPIKVKFLPKADPPRAEVDFTAFDAAMERAIEKYHVTNFRLPIEGVGGGSCHARNEPDIDGFTADTPQYQAVIASYLKQLNDHFRAKGWLNKAYIYWFDEPRPVDYGFVREGMERLKKYAPDLQTMLTEQPKEALVGPVDIWCPNSPNYHREAAQRRMASGERFWWYLCCNPKAPYCTLFIDHPAAELRVWMWQTWQRDIAGVLVWSANYWTSMDDPLQNPYLDPMGYVSGTKPSERQHWGNGDGRFIYPPLSAFDKRYGDGPVLEPPVSSIRWEMVREGIEDYEYLWLLRDLISRRRDSLSAAQLREHQSLLEVPASITRYMTTFTTDPRPILKRRAAVAEAIERLLER
ncbi:MAG: family 10 glycosylhydrolase [Pirellulales bacterium]|nr:family 10 glycosylhydrolase [Pirellulales bacterium]